MRETRDFDRGYITACANIVNLYGGADIAAEVIRALDVSWEDVKRMRLSSYDMEALRQVRRQTDDPFRAALTRKDSR